IILFQDEASIQFSPTITRMWSLKGHQPEILTFGGRKRQHLIGAVEPLAGRVHVPLSEAMKAKQFEHFLEGLLARYKDAGKILLILDNARAHHSKELEPFLKANEEKLELMFLPPYSPDMNPMEWFWKFLRKEVTHNTFFDTFKEFQRAMIKFIIKFKLPSQEIKTRCSFSKIFSSS
ncbi:MAG: IS630 family transposase, partial [Promethearchaeota archaeon]